MFLNNLKNIATLAAGVTALALVAPASAQTAQGSNLPAPVSTTTSPHQPTSSCGTVCPSSSSIVAQGVAQFGGSLLGGFGTLDAKGNLVAGNGVTGTIKGVKTGGGDTDVTIKYNGPGCGIDCGSSTVVANVKAFERGDLTVSAESKGPGMLGIANSGSLSAASGLMLGYTPSRPAPKPAH